MGTFIFIILFFIGLIAACIIGGRTAFDEDSMPERKPAPKQPVAPDQKPVPEQDVETEKDAVLEKNSVTEDLFNFKNIGPWENWRQSHPAKWSEVIQHLKTHEFHGWGALNRVYIPVTKDSFDFVDINKYQRYISEFHMNKINEFINNGYIYTDDAMLCNDNTIEAGYCLDWGDSSDGDGFGAEPDVWLIAKLDMDGNCIEPFHLKFWRYIR